MSYTSENVASMSDCVLYSADTAFKLQVNGNVRATITRDTNQCINVYVEPQHDGTYDIYYEVSTSDHTPTASDVRKVAALDGQTNLQMDGGKDGDVPIVTGKDDIRYGTVMNPDTLKFNVMEITYVICVKYALYNWSPKPNSTDNRNTACIKITSPNPGGESDCANLPKQSFCYCSDC